MTIAIRNLQAVATDSETMVVTWNNTDSYNTIEIEYNQSGGAWAYLDDLGGHVESYIVDGVTTNIIYGFRARARSSGSAWSSYSNEDYTACYSNTITETITLTSAFTDNYITGNLITAEITLTDIISDNWDITETITETMTLTDYIVEARSVSTNWGYYLTDSDGKVFAYDDSYLSDDGTAIAGRWISKQTDFSDQDPSMLDVMKTVYEVKLHYVDWTDDIKVSVAISTDSGVTWNESVKTLGDATERTKTADYFFRVYGENFMFKVENTSTDAKFQFVQLDVFYRKLGDAFPT